MLEILLIRALVRSIGTTLEAKGHKAGWYQFIAVICWIGGEIAGFVVGALMDLGTGAYLTALMGAAAGAGFSYWLAQSVKPMPALDEGVSNVFD
jgi:hypothetical protein